MPTDNPIDKFRIDIPEHALTDLRRRLASVRWPERETVQDWSQGVPLDRLQSLCAYWAGEYDWRVCEARLNEYEHFRTTIDGPGSGLGIHFMHVRSPRSDALPMILTHGWPGSVIEFLNVIGPLSDPERHGAVGAPAFHLVIPSLPGFGFSDKPTAPGWNVARIASAWGELMRRLGYRSFVAQGGDFGAAVTTTMAKARTPGLQAIHLNMALVTATENDLADLTAAESAAVATLREFELNGSGYRKQQSTRPQTLGYALTDSPAGQAAWIYEKFQAWTDNQGEPEQALARDAMLDNITLYWLTGTATSSARLYWESQNHPSSHLYPIDLPVGVSIFPKETFRPSRRWAQRCYADILYWNELERGGHFAAFEQPALFVDELRKCFANKIERLN